MTITNAPRQNNGLEESGANPRIAASVSGLEKTFTTKDRTVHALRGIDLHIADGEYVVVLGPSGCGKTTLIRCISGLEAPTSGRIGLKDLVVFDASSGADIKPNKRNVGLVFQNYALWPHMSVERNVGYPLRMRKIKRSERDRMVKAVLTSLETPHLADRLPAELSGGQQQRIALARALVSEPGILLLDEPLSNLDALLRVSLRAELLRLHRKIGFTAIHITHDQEEALEMGDRVVLMREGRIEQVGPPAEVYAHPVSPYAANFLGVRNQMEVTLAGGRLSVDGSTIEGSEAIAARCSGGDGLQLFVRDQDARLAARHGNVDPDELRLHGTLAQVVLGAGGRPRYIVDVAGRQWYAANTTVADAHPGDEVDLVVASERALVYQGESLV
ncbi:MULTISPECIES: ABC transporter ATP-binding protein [unclassified Microbacterium]|uniref:ABC transporter ATP-binding protein n=1 Tax=unclassified Microbacterium TaxID=2609290 RepID=UPI00214CA11C|nr:MULTISPECIES: ABC transporter ATP-binding protein [unclassified Microbacterium]MCR2811390.1 ABC transporter ATP-binding protein [Microbacterium sp. zg.B185]WIM19564.1 ABC transporter ATP-binding protein [Microbacterium sp. zg-B185]